MPKTFCGLWERVVNWDNLVLALRKAEKGKRYRDEVLRYKHRWEENLLNLQNHLIWGSWEPAPLRTFYVHEPKLRLIEAPAFRDRVLHHALNNIVEPIFESKFIFDSYACRAGKGTHAAVSRLQGFLRQAKQSWGRVYVLQADISRYFPSIDHNVLIKQVARTVRESRVLDIWYKVISWFRDKIGLPIGALTSQLSANINLDPFDHHIKDDLGHPFYLRYMDDWIVLGPDKSRLRDTLKRLEGWLYSHLGLRLNNKSRVYSSCHGVDFAGYRTWATHILPRKRNVRRARRRFKKMVRLYAEGKVSLDTLRGSVASFVGYTRYCNAHKTTQEILDDLKKLNATIH